MRRISAIAEWILRLPLVWGGVACLGYYALLTNGIIDSPRLVQYTFGSNIEVMEMAVFFIGAAALVLRLLQLAPQFAALHRELIEAAPENGQRIDDCGRLLAQLGRLPQRLRETYVVRRLWEALSFVQRRGTADALEPHLRHLEELDAVEIQSSYSLVRVIIWVTPILGFLGTVVGITIAVANLDPRAIAGVDPQTLEQAMSRVTDGLSGAFDTTATALVLTTILMFAMTGVRHVEDRLLAQVDDRVSAELIGRFRESVVENDQNVAVVRRMSEQVIEACETLAARQAEVWRDAIHQTHQQWADVSIATGQILKDSLSSGVKENLELHARLLNEGVQKHADRLSTSAALHSDKLDRSTQETVARLREGLERLAELLVDALHRHGEVLTASEKELAEENRRHLAQVESALSDTMVVAADRQEQLIRQSESLLKEMQIALVEAAGATVRQQEQLVKQGDVLLRVVDATGQVRKLEEALNDNLAALNRGFNFEEITETLSAAIALLNARLRHVSSSPRAVEIAGSESADQAA